jgi:putative tricarboxylic transport membrane protein
MDLLSSILVPFQNPWLLLYIFGGTFVGMYVGAIPGLSGTMALALLLSFTYGWGVLPALGAMIGIHVGACFGGSRSAILLNIPGTPAAIATAFDGYPLAQQGKAAKAIGVSVVQSFLGGLIGCIALLTLTPIIANFALSFSPRDYFLLAMMGLTLISGLSGKSFWKGIFCGMLGLLIGTVGLDYATGGERYSFGNIYLTTGVNFIIAMIGLFGFSEALVQLRNNTKPIVQEVDNLKFSFKGTRKYGLVTLQSSIIGMIIGALPGTGGDIASLFAYDQAKRMVKHPTVPFGKGAIEGLVASESANNAAAPAAYIPMLTLGIPGDAASALIIGALYIHGLNPGPMLMIQNPSVVGIIVGGMIVAQFCILAVGFTGIKAFAKITEIPKNILMPIILVLCVVGSYAINDSMMDVVWMVGFGIFGYFLSRHDYPSGPIILGIILSNLFESNLRRTITLAQFNAIDFFKGFITSPLSFVLTLIIVLIILKQTPLWNIILRKGKMHLSANDI